MHKSEQTNQRPVEPGTFHATRHWSRRIVQGIAVLLSLTLVAAA